MAKRQWKCLEIKRIFSSPWLCLENHRVRSPAGHEFQHVVAAKHNSWRPTPRY